MNKFIIAASAAFLLLSASSTAQTTPASSSGQQVSVQDEIRATSGQLKEAYGLVTEQLALLNREIEAGTEATAAQAAQRDQLTTALSQLEGMLTTVNTANEEAWPEIKAKSETVRTGALNLVQERKSTP